MEATTRYENIDPSLTLNSLLPGRIYSRIDKAFGNLKRVKQSEGVLGHEEGVPIDGCRWRMHRDVFEVIQYLKMGWEPH